VVVVVVCLSLRCRKAINKSQFNSLLVVAVVRAVADLHYEDAVLGKSGYDKGGASPQNSQS